MNTEQLATLAKNIKHWGQELGFAQIGISDIDLTEAEQNLNKWLNNGFHGDMDYMQKHGEKRSRPALLHSGTVRVISVRMPYLPESQHTMQQHLDNPSIVSIIC